MSITKSYNKHNNTYYAYDTTYVWDETAQRKIQKKVCIGKYDPETGQVIPNAKRGRPSAQKTTTAGKTYDRLAVSNNVSRIIVAAIEEIAEIESSISMLEERIRQLKERILTLRDSISEE